MNTKIVKQYLFKRYTIHLFIESLTGIHPHMYPDIFIYVLNERHGERWKAFLRSVMHTYLDFAVDNCSYHNKEIGGKLLLDIAVYLQKRKCCCRVAAACRLTAAPLDGVLQQLSAVLRQLSPGPVTPELPSCQVYGISPPQHGVLSPRLTGADTSLSVRPAVTVCHATR